MRHFIGMSRVGLAPKHACGYNSGATRCPLLPLSPGTVGQQDTRDWTRPTKWTRAIGRGPPNGHARLDVAQQASAIFIIYLKNAYQIRKRFFFVYSLPFPASEPNASIAARRCLRFATQVGPCFFSHLLLVSFFNFSRCRF